MNCQPADFILWSISVWTFFQHLLFLSSIFNDNSWNRTKNFLVKIPRSLPED